MQTCISNWIRAIIYILLSVDSYQCTFLWTLPHKIIWLLGGKASSNKRSIKLITWSLNVGITCIFIFVSFLVLINIYINFTIQVPFVVQVLISFHLVMYRSRYQLIWWSTFFVSASWEHETWDGGPFHVFVNKKNYAPCVHHVCVVCVSCGG